MCMFQKIQILLILTLLLIGNFSFADECPKGKYWVSPHFRRAYVRYDGAAVRATNVQGYCKENPRGYEKWHQRLSNARPKVWNYKQEKSKKWTTEEIERMYDAISILPDKLLDLGKVEIHRMIESVNKGNPATTNFYDVVLYDLAFNHKVPAEQILAHELSHPLYYSLNNTQRVSFAHSSDWKEISDMPGAWIAKKKKVFIEEDSRTSLVEDFANHIEHYLFKNESLKNNSPESYKWIQKTFGENFKIQEKK